MKVQLSRAPSALALSSAYALLVGLFLASLVSFAPVKAARRAQNQCQSEISASPRSVAVPEAGGLRTIEIKLSQACAWTARLAPDTTGWISIVGASSGTTSGQIQISVAPNAAASVRYGTITINNQNISIGQQAAFNKCQTQPITPGVSVNGALASDGCLRTLASGQFSFSHAYSFNGRAGEGVFVTLQAQPVNSNVSVLVLNSAGQTPEPLAILPTIFNPIQRLPADGAYQLEVYMAANAPPATYRATLQLIPPGCEGFSVNALDQNFGSTGGGGRVMVSALRNCSWQAVSDTAWLTLPTFSGQGSQALNFNVAENNTLFARSATINVAGQTTTIRQAGRGSDCGRLHLTPGEPVSGILSEGDCALLGDRFPRGDLYEFQGRAGERISLESVTIPSGQFTNARLMLLNARGETLAQNDRRLPLGQDVMTLTEDGWYSVLVSSFVNLSYTLTLNLIPADCAYSISPARSMLSGNGDTVNVSLLTQPHCRWKLAPAEDAAWMRQPAETQGAGSRTLAFVAPANTSGGRRGATFYLGGQPIEFIQGGAGNACGVTPLAARTPIIGALDGTDCPARLVQQSTDSYFFQLPGDRFSFSGTAGQVFTFTVTPSAPALYAPPQIAPVGFGLLDPQGKLIWAGQTNANLPQQSLVLPATGNYQFELSGTQNNTHFNYALTIQLTPVECATYATVSATRFEAAGGNGVVQIQAAAGCPWRLERLRGEGQIHFSDPLTGLGPGQVRFVFPVNTTNNAALSVLRLGDQVISLGQAGGGGTCLASVLPFDQFTNGQVTTASCPKPIANINNWELTTLNRHQFIGRAGEQVALTFPRQEQTAFTPTIAGATFRLYDPEGNLMNGTLATRTLGGRFLLPKAGTYLVEVEGGNYQVLLERLTAGCLYTAMSNGLQRFDSGGGNGTYRMLTGSSCQWTPRVNAPWVSLTNPTSATNGNAAGAFSVAFNSQNLPRLATIVTGGQALEIEQAGADGKCAIKTLTPYQPVNETISTSDCWNRVGQGYGDLYQFTARDNERLRIITTNHESSPALGYVASLLDSQWRTLPISFGDLSQWMSLPAGDYFVDVRGNLAVTPYTIRLETQPATCQYYVSPLNALFFGIGGAGTLNLVTGAGCPWTARTGIGFDAPSWINFTSPTSGTGSATLTYHVQPYELIGGARFSPLSVTQQTVAITQIQAASPDTCDILPLAFGQSVTGSLATADCVSRFLTYPHPQYTRADRYSFKGQAGQQYAFELTGAVSAQMLLYDSTFRVIAQTITNNERLPLPIHNQPASAPLRWFVLPDDQTYFLEIASSNVAAPINYSVKLTTPSQCAYSLAQLSPSAQLGIPAEGGNAMIRVFTGAGCAWAMRNDEPNQNNWLTVANPASGSGPGTVTLNFARNETMSRRATTVSLGSEFTALMIEQVGNGGICGPRTLTAGQTVRSNLRHSDCHRVSLSQGEQLRDLPSSPTHTYVFSAKAGDQLAIIPRLANPGDARLTLYDPLGQPVPNATHVFRIPVIFAQPPVHRMPLTMSGSYTLSVSGFSGEYEFVLDLTTNGCRFVLETDNAQLVTAGNSGTVRVTAASGCSWTAYTETPWVTLANQSGVGNGSFSFTAAAHSGDRTRIADIRLSGEVLRLTQSGAAGECAPRPIIAGQSLTGTLTRQGCHRANGQVVARYRFTARAGESAQVKVVNTAMLGVQILPLSSLSATSAVTTPIVFQPPQPTDWFGTASLVIPADGDYLIEILTATAEVYSDVPYSIHLQINAPGCGVVLNESESTHAASTSSGAFSVIAPTGCRWQTYALNDWITVNGTRERIGLQSVSYSLAANPETKARWGAIIAGGQIHIIEQAGAGNAEAAAGTCQTAALTAGQTVFGELSPADCRPLSTTSEALTADRYRFSGTTGQRIQIFARFPELPNLRRPLLTVFDRNGQMLDEAREAANEQPAHTRIPSRGDFFRLPADGEYIIEIGLPRLFYSTDTTRSTYSLALVNLPTGCGYSTSAQPLRFNAAGDNGTINVVTGSACGWSAVSLDQWVISAAETARFGSGTLSFTVQPNGSSQSRRSLLLVNGSVCVIEQAGIGGSCLAMPITPGQTVTSALDSNDCPTTALPQRDVPNNGATPYSERYVFEAQANDRIRLTVTRPGDSVKTPLPVMQLSLKGPDGLITFSSFNGSLPASAAFGTLPLTGTYEIEIGSSGTFPYSLTFQLSRGNCQLTATPRETLFESAGGNGQITLTASNANCAWQAISNSPWVTASTASGSGSATLNYTVAANATPQARVASLVIGDQVVTIYQAGTSGQCAARGLMRNQIMQGRWDAGGCGFLRATNPASNNARYEDRYVFAATANERFSFTLQTPAVVAPTIELYDPQGRRFAQAVGKRLPTPTGELLLPLSGSYTLIISSSIPASYQLLASDSSSCSFTISPNPLNVTAASGKRSLQITASQPQCAWSVRSTVNWLALPTENTNSTATAEARLFTGSRALELDVSANTSATPRTGYLHLADRVVTVQQAAQQLIPVNEPLACVNAATYGLGAQAPDSLIAAFGQQLATVTVVAAQLTTSLGGTTVTVTDSANVVRSAFVLFVSPTQVNFVMPAGTAEGLALVEIVNGNHYVSSLTLPIISVVPGLFSANGTGKGIVNGVVLRVKADQTQVYESLLQYDARAQDFIPQPIIVNRPEEKVFLVLFGTGWRWRTDLASVSARAGNLNLPVHYCGASDARFAGLDQLNLELPVSLAGSGSLTLDLTVDGKNANPLRFVIK